MPYEKCYRKELMPQIENVAQIILRAPEGGRPNGVKHEGKTGGNEGIQAPGVKRHGKKKNGFCWTSSPGWPTITGNPLSGF
jgi:hypothetical protein